MEPIVSIIMGSTSDLPVMEKAAKLLDEMHVPFEMNALSAHRTPEAVEEFAKNAAGRGIKVIIAAAARCNCRQHYTASHWRPCERVCSRWCGRTLFHHPDASRNSGCNSCHQRCNECRYSGRTDVGFE